MKIGTVGQLCHLKPAVLASFPGADVDLALSLGATLEAPLLGVLPVDGPPEEGLAREAAAAAVVHVLDGHVAADATQRVFG